MEQLHPDFVARSGLTLRSMHGDSTGRPLGPGSRESVVECGLPEQRPASAPA